MTPPRDGSHDEGESKSGVGAFDSDSCAEEHASNAQASDDADEAGCTTPLSTPPAGPWCKDELRRDRAVVLAAVAQNGRALEHASGELGTKRTWCWLRWPRTARRCCTCRRGFRRTWTWCSPRWLRDGPARRLGGAPECQGRGTREKKRKSAVPRLEGSRMTRTWCWPPWPRTGTRCATLRSGSVMTGMWRSPRWPTPTLQASSTLQRVAAMADDAERAAAAADSSHRHKGRQPLRGRRDGRGGRRLRWRQQKLWLRTSRVRVRLQRRRDRQRMHPPSEQ